ncbi:hypothetical protein SRB5_13300 [Streptomyces sp. RB5]|uniref:DUF2382 domain-containing protein n=1 Tax=Streptomyces smaragdinus TaxID=2585196 RepID=A0A7K0CCM7_9ACTN|nr:DUF2382 domain-containing protein [Streptomyces smaragdinus]MQY11215.1 hypothetical protein [Streptomyces smaragdinus]
MQSDKNEARGGSGGLGKGAMDKATDAAQGLGAERKSAGLRGRGESGGMSETGIGREHTGLSEAEQLQAGRAMSSQQQEVWAYRERLEVEAAKSDQEIGRASVSIRVTEHPERFEITRGHDEAVISRAEVQGDLVPGRHHEFVDRSIELPLFGEGNEVVVRKVSEPYAKCSLGVNRVAETQTFETTLRQEEIVENNPAARQAGAASAITIREVEEGYEMRDRAGTRERDELRQNPAMQQGRQDAEQARLGRHESRLSRSQAQTGTEAGRKAAREAADDVSGRGGKSRDKRWF